MPREANLTRLLVDTIGDARATALLDSMQIAPALCEEGLRDDAAGEVSRAVIAQALNMVLFEDLVRRVPAAAAYVADCRASGERLLHDHGAVRTIALHGMGALPAGEGGDHAAAGAAGLRAGGDVSARPDQDGRAVVRAGGFSGGDCAVFCQRVAGGAVQRAGAEGDRAGDGDVARSADARGGGGAGATAEVWHAGLCRGAAAAAGVGRVFQPATCRAVAGGLRDDFDRERRGRLDCDRGQCVQPRDGSGGGRGGAGGAAEGAGAADEGGGGDFGDRAGEADGVSGGKGRARVYQPWRRADCTQRAGLVLRVHNPPQQTRPKP